MDILIGADPEIFVRKDGKFITGHGLVPGTKYKPFKVDEGAVQVDGMALEFNIDPCSTSEQFVSRIDKVMAHLKSMIEPSLELVAKPTADFDPEYMKTMPKEALELGCDPDFNAWLDGAPNLKPDGNRNFRTGAGHVHIGWTSDQDINDPDHMEACVMLTKQLDFYLGVPSINYDQDDRRRTMYGDFGAFRPKPYGVEYRVLSNAWLTDKRLMAWVFDSSKQAFNDLLEGKYVQNIGLRATHLRQLKAKSKLAAKKYASMLTDFGSSKGLNIILPPGV